MHKVLVFPCGSQVSQEVSDSLYCRRDVYLVGVGSRGSPSYGSYDEVRSIKPSVGDRSLPREIMRVCREVGSEFIFACNDSAHLQLSRSCVSKMLIGSCHATSKALSLKSSTYAALSGKLPVPAVGHRLTPPVFVKPDNGSGSRGCRVARTASEMLLVQRHELACELVKGEEYTTDCFTDRKGRLLFSLSRSRDEIRSGMSVRASVRQCGDLRSYAQVINETFALRGGWFFQTIRRESGEQVVIEVNPRIASCSSITRASGYNMALMSLMDHLGIDLEASRFCEVSSQTKSLHSHIRLGRGFSELFVDFDDCLMLRHGLNTGLMRLVFDCKNRGMKVAVISKHRGDLMGKLRSLGIDRVFDNVFHIGRDDRKSDHLHADALLVDDSFRERRQAAESSGCQCLSPDLFARGELLL